MSGRWVHVPGKHRCEVCSGWCIGAWLYFTKPGTWAHCVCDACAEKED